jgi:hypothetical protein
MYPRLNFEPNSFRITPFKKAVWETIRIARSKRVMMPERDIRFGMQFLSRIEGVP